MDLYIVLGVEREATDADIRKAYRRLARRFHPDINPGDREAAARFRVILTAYETLIDPDRRRRYDSGSAVGPVEQASAFGFTGFDFSGATGHHPTTTFGDLFADVLTRRVEDAIDGRRTIAGRRSRQSEPVIRAGVARRRVAVTLNRRNVSRLRRQRASARRRIAVPRLRRIGHGAIGPRPHGVLEELSAVWRHRPLEPAALSRLSRPARGNRAESLSVHISGRHRRWRPRARAGERPRWRSRCTGGRSGHRRRGAAARSVSARR